METEQTSEEERHSSKDSNRREKQARRKSSMGDAISRKVWPDLTTLEEPTPLDHRSFVQNVFGTVAFKMLEWLSPRNLDILARSGDRKIKTEEGSPVEVVITEDSKATEVPVEGGKLPTVVETVPVEEIVVDDSKAAEIPVETDPSKAQEGRVEHLHEAVQQSPCGESPPKASSMPPTPTKLKADAERKPIPKLVNQNSITKRPSSLRKKTDPHEAAPSRELVNKMTSEPIAEVKQTLPSHVNSMTGRKMSRKTLITSPKMQIADTAPALHELKFMPPASILENDSPSLKDDESEISQDVPEAQKRPQNIAKEVQSPQTPPEKRAALPQSLSHLSIEVIELVCDILQSDGTFEKHFLQPQIIDETLKRRRDNSVPLSRDLSMQKSSPKSSSSKQQWKLFIEQSIFDALSRPEPLLRSFSDDNGRLFDTQTIWYLMLRMTRVAPSLVFDCLWQLAGSLFKPPQKLEAYEWARELQSQEPVSQKPLSNLEAAQAINICLHALVAAVPLVSDARQLANMSRIRSYGLAMLGREASSLEPATLCLQYEDAFTSDLAVRLARRLFAAISTRRRFTELLNLQIDLRKDEKPQPDVLDTVLGTLKFLDLDTPPIISFPDDERDLHEKRVPTLILDWARTVMLQDWEGAAEVPSDGPFGGALATMAAICKSQ